jgi:hypothetical protein
MERFTIIEIDGKFGLEKNGSIVLNATYDKITQDNKEGFLIKKNFRYGYFSIYRDGLFLKPVFTSVKTISLNKILEEINVNGRSGHANIFKFLYVQTDLEHAIYYPKNDFFTGLIPINEKFDLSIFYSDGKEMVNHFYFVENGKIRIIHLTGKDLVYPFKYSLTKDSDNFRNFHILESNGLFDIFNKSFQKLNDMPFKNYFFDSMSNLCLVQTQSNWILYDLEFKALKYFTNIDTKGKHKPRFVNYGIFISENKKFKYFDWIGQELEGFSFAKIERIGWDYFLVTNTQQESFVIHFGNPKFKDVKIIYGPIDELIPIKKDITNSSLIQKNSSGSYFLSFSKQTKNLGVLEVNFSEMQYFEIGHVNELKLLDSGINDHKFRTRNGFIFSITNVKVKSSQFLKHVV